MMEVDTIFLGHKEGCPWVENRERRAFGFMMIPTGKRGYDIEVECVECMRLKTKRINVGVDPLSSYHD